MWLNFATYVRGVTNIKVYLEANGAAVVLVECIEYVVRVGAGIYNRKQAGQTGHVGSLLRLHQMKAKSELDVT